MLQTASDAPKNGNPYNIVDSELKIRAQYAIKNSASDHAQAIPLPRMFRKHVAASINVSGKKINEMS